MTSVGALNQGMLQHEKVTKGASHLGSKRGVMRGVASIIIEESSMFLAGVNKFFLVDLKRTDTDTDTDTHTHNVRQGNMLSSCFNHLEDKTINNCTYLN